MSNIFSCYIVGEESLAVQCADLILAQGHNLWGIVSSNLAIRDWAHDQQIPYFDSCSSYEEILLKTNFDYLFSIVNNGVLSAALLKRPNGLAINYHDALLPRYAGMHATSWAILQREKRHGITWHVMTEQVDAGDILKQEQVSIEPDETALSLNLKCYQAAVKAFNELLLELANEQYVRLPQDLALRTYYAYRQKPVGNGWVSWNDSAQDLAQLYRALKFGDYPNRLSVLKFQIGKQSYVIDEFKPLAVTSNQLAGTLINLDQGWQISTKTHDVLITRVKTLDNQICDLKILAHEHHLTIGKKLRSPPKKLQLGYQQVSEEIFRDENFWLQQLLLFQPVTLPFLSEKGNINSNYCIGTFELSTALQQALKQQCPGAESMEQVLLTALLIYFYRINDKKTVGIDLSYPNLLKETQSFSSLLADFVPLNLTLDQTINFSAALTIVQQQLSSLKQHRTYLRDIYVRYPELRQVNHSSIGIVYNDSQQEASLAKLTYPVTILLEENRCSLYISRHSKNENLHHFLAHIPGHLQVLLEGVANNFEQSISGLPLLTLPERQKILVDWNKTDTNYPRDKTVSQLFTEQVEKTPDHIAVVFENNQLTYQQLNQKASQLAYYLQQQGVKPNMLVAICMERSLEMIISVLAIVKAGAIYLPLDRDYPIARICHIIEDSPAQFILTDKNIIKEFPEHLKKKTILLEQIDDKNQIDLQIINQKISSDFPIYYIYTSGSTGVPKGVMVSHRNVIKLARNTYCLKIDDSCVIGQLSNVAFDAATFEIWSALLNGAKLVIINKQTLFSFSALLDVIKREQISTLWLTSALFNQVYEFNPKILYLLKHLVIGGERLTPSIVKKFVSGRKDKPEIFLNGYGPTECTTFSTYYRIDKELNALPSIPIGKPISNVQCYVLDANLQPVPVGAIGELFIGGEGVSAGYLNQPEKTQHCFIPNPFVNDPQARMYRSGDKVRWLFDGNLEYIGRGDDQIKLRGFRIELGEIEAALAKHPQISQVVVTIRGADEYRKQLEAYIIQQKTDHLDSNQLNAKELSAYLKQSLPDYMIPTRFFIVDRFPLTVNGKVDKATLMASQSLQLDEKTIKTANSSTEALLVEIWQNVLKIPQISTDDNFFMLGGDSIIAMQIVAKANQSGLQLAVQDIFQYPILSDLASRVTQKSASQIEVIEANRKFALAPIQAWFFEQCLIKKECFNQVGLLTIEGAVDIELLERCFSALLARHEGLRLRFAFEQGIGQQYYTDVEITTDKVIHVVNSANCDATALNELIKYWTYQLSLNFNLASGPLLKAALFSGHAKNSSKLLIVVHHLIIDGVSWRVLLTELQMLYQTSACIEKVRVVDNWPQPSSATSRGLSAGSMDPADKPRDVGFEMNCQHVLTKSMPKSSSYQAWIDSLIDEVNCGNLTEEQSFWLAIDQHFHALPIDHRQGKNLEKSTASLSLELTEEETKYWLHGLSIKQDGIKPQEILIAILAKTLAGFANTNGIVFDLENHGREPLFKPLDLSQTIGWFTSLFPVYLAIDDQLSLEEIVLAVKRQLQKIPRQGIGYGLLRYIKKVNFLHQSEVVFNYWGQFDQIFDQQNFKFDSLQLVSHPDNQRSHLLNVDAVVKNKQLSITWTYSANFHCAATIQQLAQNYIDDLRRLILRTQQKLAFSHEAVIVGERGEEVYPLSPLQQGLLFHAIQAPNSEAYMVQLVWRIPGELAFSVDAFIRAWQLLVDRHEAFRTAFIWEELAEPIQVVSKHIKLPYSQYSWLNCADSSEQEDRLSAFLYADRQVGFNLKSAPLLRLVVIKLPEQQYCLVATLHHILLDGWSMSILINELDYYYQGSKQINLLPLPLPKSYTHYLKWLAQQDSYAAKSFWQNYLLGFSAPTDLSAILKHNQLITRDKVDIQLHERILPAELVKQLKQFCQAQHVTLSTLFQGIWALILSRYSQSDEVVFGVTCAVRSADIPEVSNIVGLLINTLPLRVNLSQTHSVKNYLSKIQNDLLQISQYQYVSLADLHSWSGIQGGISLFDSILVFENYPNTGDKNYCFKLANTQIIDPTHYPLSCIILPGDQFVIRLAYDKNVIATEAIQRLHGHLHALLTDLIAYPQKNVHQLNLLTQEEQQKLLIDWNKTQVDYPSHKTVQQLFEEQVERTPDQIAVIFEEQQLTYRQLNEQANQLARYLQKQNIEPEQVVAIFLDRGLTMIIAILGILKAGSAYLPIDLKYPPERIRYMLQDSNTVLLLTQEPLWKQLDLSEFDQSKLIFLEQKAHYSSESSSNLEMKYSSNQLMYVIYTSGSTGIPKGVMVEHQSVVNFLTSICSEIKPNSKDTLLALTPLIFDISGLEIYLPLIVGARCVIASTEAAVDGNKLKEIITNHQISILQATPMTWKMLITAGWAGSSTLKILCGGEALSTELAKQLLAKAPHFWNLYGPTETTIWSTINYIDQVDENYAIVPIGKPLANTQVYVLDPARQPVPIGIVGELYIGGAGLARSYLNHPELTEEKFITNPFTPNTRLYCTGDLVRWRPDGSLEYLGRADEQVKINGFRIELGEIRAQLEKHPNVLQAVITNCENAKGEEYLLAYVISRVKANFDSSQLRSFLQQFFPHAMVPSVFVALDKFPLTSSGKIDKKALPSIEQQQELFKSYVKPSREEEKILADIWTEILGISQISIHDDFFTLGAHSLSALQLLAKLRQYFKINLPMRVLFDKPTISELVDVIKLIQSETEVVATLADKQPSEILASCIVPLRREGSKTPLFLVHPIGGTIFWYIPLIKYFDRDRPLYAIQDPGIESDSIPFNSTAEMASFYINAIKTVQPYGPYLLGGSSAGANVSVEMSHQLVQKGEQVAFIGLLDGWAFYPDSLQNQEFFEAIMRKQYHDMENIFIAKGIDKAEKLLKLQWARSKMNNRYLAPYLYNKLTLFKAEKTLEIFESMEAPYNHWEKHSSLPIERYIVPGNHETMFQEPNVLVLAEKLNQCLNESEIFCQQEMSEIK